MRRDRRRPRRLPRLRERLRRRRLRSLTTRRPGARRRVHRAPLPATLPAPPLVLVTRPRAQADALVAAIERLGLAALVAPVIEIAFDPDFRVDLTGVQAVLLTSSNGARALSAATAERDVRVLAVGDSTAATAREHGFADVESATGDIEALAQLAVARLDPSAGPLLHVAGSDVAGDLAGRLGQAGFEVRRAVGYRAVPASALAPEAVEALRRGRIRYATFLSPRTADIFVTLAEQAQILQACRAVRAICLSRAVADAAAAAPWAGVRVAETPDMAALTAALEQEETGVSRMTEKREIEQPHPSRDEVAPPPRRNAGIVAGLGLALAIGILVALAIVVLQPSVLRDALTIGDDPAVRAQTDRIRALESRLAEMGEPPAPVPIADPELRAALESLADTVRGLEARLDERTDTDPALVERLDGVTAAVRAVESKLDAIAADQRAAAGRVDELQRGFEERSGALAERLAAVEQRAEQARPARIAESLLAIGDVRRVMASGRPFGAALDRLRAALPAAVEVPEADWVRRADRGLPTVDALATGLDEIARRDASGVAVSTGMGWLDRTAELALGGIRVRQVEGPDRLATIDRARERLAADDLGGAIEAVESLPEQAAAAYADWLETARLRHSADAGLDRIEAAVVDLAAGSG